MRMHVDALKAIDNLNNWSSKLYYCFEVSIAIEHMLLIFLGFMKLTLISC